MDSLETVLSKIRNRYKKDIGLAVFIAEGIKIISDYIIENNNISNKDANFLDTEFDIMINNIIKEEVNFNKLTEHNKKNIWDYVEENFTNNYYYFVNKVSLLENLIKYINIFGR